MASSYKPDVDDINSFVVASIAVAAGFVAWNGSLGFETGLFYLGATALVLLTREFGQRTVAEWQDAYVDLKLSTEGVLMTLAGALFSILTQTPIILLFPVSSAFSGRKYEHWGKTISAVWMKRQYWMVMGGLVALFIGGLASLVTGYSRIAEVYFIFTAFQLLPFDYSKIPTGRLDGAYVLRWNGYTWVFLMSAALAGTALAL